MKLRKWICLALALLLLAVLLPRPEARADAGQTAALTFSDNAITETAPGAGYTLSGTTLTITAAGTYRISGQCAEGSVIVSKGLRNVTLILDDLNLTSAVTAPIVVKKESSVLLTLEGESTLTDNEDASTEDTNADFEGACIKVKSGGSLTVSGDGTLNAAGNAKNGLKGAAQSALVVDGGCLNVQAANNAVAFDGSVEINAGTLNLTADGDGLKSEPDETDAASAGTVTVRGGELTIRAQGDGIHAKTDLTVTGGSFDIRTLDGCQSRSFNSDAMSCKGLKASDGAAEDSASRITISGGVFLLDTADDAIHSDGDVSITFGTFEICTGDDGVHAEAALTLGTEGGYERDPEITIRASYEGLEGSKIDAYSGKYYIVADDDGMNAAGGSANGADPFGPGGGWRPSGPGGGPGGGASGDHSINFYGGEWYVDCKGDGLDSNGALNLYGGDFTVLSMGAGGDNSPLDADGGIHVQGATVFGAGSAGMSERPSSASQKYYTDSTRRSAGTVVNVSYDGRVVRSEQLVRNISYLFWSSPEMTSAACTTAAANELSIHHSNAFAHDWDGGKASEEPGVTIYTCACGATERKTADPPEAADPGGCGHDYKAAVTAPTCTEPGFTTYTCAKCGDSYTTDETAALGHSFADGICARCGAADPDYVPPVDRTALEKAVADAEALKEADYTPESYAALEEALESARALPDDAAQQQVDDAEKAVKAAIEALEETFDGFLFEDVKDPGKFYYDAVYWAFYADPQITNGIDETHFGPEDPCTRGHVVTFLWRAAGEPEPTSAQTPFTDLKPGAFYEKAVAWAVEKGITKGETDTTFAPDANCTRGQIVTFLWRFKEEPAPKSATTPFTDVNPSGYYKNAVAWAVEEGVTKGLTETTFGPEATCTRGQVVTFLHRAAAE